MNSQMLRESPVAIIEENELPSWRSPEQLVEAVRAMGADLVRYPAIRWGVHTFGSCSALPSYPGLEGRDLFGEVSEAMHRAGIRVMAYCHYGVIHCTCAKLHPEWLAREADGTPAHWAGQPNHFRACMSNGDFIAAMRNAISELCRSHSFEALYLDGPTWYGECECRWCRERYLERYGEERPVPVTFADGSLGRNNALRDEQVADIVRDIAGVAGDRPLLFNMCLDQLATHRTGCPERTNADAGACGGNTTEIHRPGSFWHTLQTLRLGEALGGVSLGYLPPGPYDTLRNFDSAEVDVLNGAYLMHGATPMLCATTTFLNDRTGAPRMAAAARLHREQAVVYHRAVPLREIALVYPRHSFDTSPPEKHDRIARAFHGTVLALLQGHRHFSAFFDTQITAERLAEYAVVALPGATSLPPDQLAALLDYVRHGGRVMLSARFQAPEDFLGLTFVAERPDAPYHSREYRETAPRFGYSAIPEAYLRMTASSLAAISPLLPVSDAVVGVPGLKRFIDYVVTRRQPDAKELAQLHLPSGGAFGEPPSFPLGAPPGIVLNRYGQGRVMTLAAELGSIYERRRLPEVRRVLVELFDQLHEDAWTVRLSGPAGVVMNVTRGDGRLYVHLLNYCGSCQDGGFAVEDTVPVHGLVLTFNIVVRSLRRLGDQVSVPVAEGRALLPPLVVFDTYEVES